MADHYGLDHTVIAAQVQVESGGNHWAWNPEPRYRYLWDVRHSRPFRPLTDTERASEAPPADFFSLAGDLDQEWWGQQASWGLLQIMGAVAREHGFAEPYLTELLDPSHNLDLGCRHLKGLMVWAKGNIEQALAAYNGGQKSNSRPPYRNQAYADKVLSRRTQIQELKV